MLLQSISMCACMHAAAGKPYLLRSLAKDVAWLPLLTLHAIQSWASTTYDTWKHARIDLPLLRRVVTGEEASVRMVDAETAQVQA